MTIMQISIAASCQMPYLIINDILRCVVRKLLLTVLVFIIDPPEGIQLLVSEEEVCNGTTTSFICSTETANPMKLNYQLDENNTMIGVISSTGVWNKTSWTVGGVFFYKCVVNNSVGTAMSLNVSVNVNGKQRSFGISEKMMKYMKTDQ